jgi:precorrin-8X/cobalt-precorrin-8 methylmutase
MAGIAHVRRLLRRWIAEGRRVLVGFDLPYGYPVGFARWMDRRSDVSPWRMTWDAISSRYEDNGRNLNNRFAVASELNALCGADSYGPFWCAPVAQVTATLPPRMKGYLEFPYPMPDGSTLGDLRICDARFRAAGLNIHTCWHLLGTGSVGGQGVAGIPYVAELRDHPNLAPYSKVWPFETGFTDRPTSPEGPAIVHAEIWPRVAESLMNPRVRIKDRAQVIAVVEWARRLDAVGGLGAYFDKPDDLSSEDASTAIREEGWILGTP